MKISKLIEQLKSDMETHGDVEVVMQATTLGDGYSMTGNVPSIPDVFESTVETTRVSLPREGSSKKLRLYWQM